MLTRSRLESIKNLSRLLARLIVPGLLDTLPNSSILGGWSLHLKSSIRGCFHPFLSPHREIVLKQVFLILLIAAGHVRILKYASNRIVSFDLSEVQYS